MYTLPQQVKYYVFKNGTPITVKNILGINNYKWYRLCNTLW